MSKKQTKALDLIAPNPANPRTITGERAQKLAEYLDEFGDLSGVVHNTRKGCDVLISGHQRMEVFRGGGGDLVITEDFSPAQPDGTVARGYIEMDGKRYQYRRVDWPKEKADRATLVANGTFGEWDAEKLAQWDYEPEQLEEMGVWLADMEDSGGGVPNNALNSEAKEDEEFEPRGSDTDIKMGDVFEIRHEDLRHRIVCADSTQISSFDLSLYGSVADLVFADPDFSMDFDSLIECYGNCKKHSVGNQFWVCGDKQAVALASNDLDTFTHFFIQDFRNATLVSNTAPMTRHCMIVKFGKPKMNNLKDGFMTILEIATARILKDHKATPMAKRIALPFAFISHYMTPGQTVLDCFAHSGSTMMAAQQFGVNSANIEIEPRYCQFMIDRFRFTYPDASVEKINIAPIA